MNVVYLISSPSDHSVLIIFDFLYTCNDAIHRILVFRNTFNLLKIVLEVTFLKYVTGIFFINERTCCRVLLLVLEDTQNTDVYIHTAKGQHPKEKRNERLENDALGLVVHNKELDSNAFLRCRLGDRRLIRICSWRSAGCSWVRGWS